MNKIIDNYDLLNLEDKYSECLDKLYEFEKKIYEYEDTMIKEWYNIETMNLFYDQIEYFDYIISLPKFIKMNKKKSIIEKELQKLNIKLINKENEE